MHEAAYMGTGPEQGKRVMEQDAFMYAMERVTTVPEDMEDFCRNFTGVRYGMVRPEELAEFRKDLVEWFYSGNWIKIKEGKVC